jgi:hypothetical protein
MAAGIYNILIQQGSSYSQQLTIKQPDGTPVDLTGATVRSQVRERYDDASPIVSFTTAIDADPTTGIFTLSLTDAQTAAFSFTKALYDIEIVYSDASVDRILQGNVILSKEVTK